MGSALVMPEYGVPKEGQAAEDLFLYPVNNVQLKKGEAGYYPLFTESVPFKHIYLWKIADYVDEEERYYYDRRRDEKREREEDVWHCLRMENNTKVPWTTAPAAVVNQESRAPPSSRKCSLGARNGPALAGARRSTAYPSSARPW